MPNEGNTFASVPQSDDNEGMTLVDNNEIDKKIENFHLTNFNKEYSIENMINRNNIIENLSINDQNNTPLENQIENTKEIQPNDNQIRSSRGLYFINEN